MTNEPKKRYLTSIEELKDVKRVRIEYPDYLFPNGARPSDLTAYETSGKGCQWDYDEAGRILTALQVGWPVEVIEGEV